MIIKCYSEQNYMEMEIDKESRAFRDAYFKIIKMAIREGFLSVYDPDTHDIYLSENELFVQKNGSTVQINIKK